MAKINLLPWRAERRKIREREFYSLIGVAAIAALVVMGLWWFQTGRLMTDQQDRNAYVNEEIVKLDAKIAEIEKLDRYKEKLLLRKEAIEKLQASRSQMVHLFDDLVRTLPDGIRLTGIKQEGDLLTLDGLAESSSRVSAYMRNFEKSTWMSDPDLAVVEKKGPDQRNQYVFLLKVKMKKAEGSEEDGEASADATTAVEPAGAKK